MITKTHAVKENDRILVKVTLYEKEELVHEINMAFPLDVKESTIIEEVEKAKQLFIDERKQSEKQKVTDQIHENADSIIKNLNKEPKEEKAPEKNVQ